jgi:hypothetical protein
MNTCLKYFSASLLALLTQAAFAQVPDLGAASSFALLSAAPDGGGAVTCTDSIIDADVGSSGARASVVRTRCKISGSIIAPVSDGVLKAFNDAYAAVADVPCPTNPANNLSGTLDGAILDPGVYCFAAAAAPTGTLTLRGGSNDTWLFKIGATAVGALSPTDFTVVMEGGGEACNVTWWSQAATTIVRGAFKGSVLSGAGFTATGTATTGSIFDGQALAKAGVTTTDMTVTGCEAGSRGGKSQSKCNQGVGNGPESCDPGNSNQEGNPSPFPSTRSNDEVDGAVPGNPGRMGGNK